MADGFVNGGAEVISVRRSYDAYIRIYQHIITTLSGKLSQVTIRIIPHVVWTDEEHSEHLSSRRI